MEQKQERNLLSVIILTMVKGIERYNATSSVLECVVTTNNVLHSINEQLQRTSTKAMCHRIGTASDINVVRVRHTDFDTPLLGSLCEGKADCRNEVHRIGWTRFVLLNLHVPLEGTGTDRRIPCTRASTELEHLTGKAHDEGIADDSGRESRCRSFVLR